MGSAKDKVLVLLQVASVGNMMKNALIVDNNNMEILLYCRSVDNREISR
jgi:hypothetical protein